MPAIPLHKKIRKLKMGDAIQRLNMLHGKIINGMACAKDRNEHGMILQGLNNFEIEVGFDCDSDGIPDTIDIFRQNVEDEGCCDLISTSSRTKKTSSGRRPK